MLIDFKDEDFETKIKQEDVSVVQFSAAWCGPCKSLRPIMENLSETLQFDAIYTIVGTSTGDREKEYLIFKFDESTQAFAAVEAHN